MNTLRLYIHPDCSYRKLNGLPSYTQVYILYILLSIQVNKGENIDLIMCNI